ncbi:MAG: PIN domain-containing protein [Bryobacteraceae bacterium]
MSGVCFFDTNVLVYIHDATAPDKQNTAEALFRTHFYNRTLAISTQVLQEFYVTVSRKISPDAAALLTGEYADLNPITIQPADILEAIRLQKRWKIAFWDALILASAKAAGAEVLYTEDFSSGQHYDGINAQNPFAVH